MKINPDWRADIKEFNSLDDLCPTELMIYLRHQYLSSAKDLISSSNSDDHNLGVYCSEIAETLQSVLDKCDLSFS